MTMDWDREDSLSESYEQVVPGWNASKQRLEDSISQVSLPYMTWGRPPEAPQHPPLSGNVVSNRPSIITQAHEKEAADVDASGTVAVLSDVIPSRISFITDLDERILEQAALPSMVQIRNGERDMAKLAALFINQLEASAIAAIDTETQVGQARLFVLSHWIWRASHALAAGKLQVDATTLCLKVTAELYTSMLTVDGQATTAKPTSLDGMRKATLHRLFGLFYPYTRAQGAASSTTTLSCQSMTFLSKLLRDEGLRPTQLRFLCRRYLVRLENLATMKSQACNQERLWHEAIVTFKALIPLGTLISPTTDATVEPTSSNCVDSFLWMLCLALQKGNINYTSAKTAIMDLARASQVVHMHKKTFSSGEGSDGGTSASISQECNLSVAPFVSQSTLEGMTKLLCQSGHYELAKEVALMAPREQRSIRVLSFLMRKWSSVLPDLMRTEGDKKRERARGRVGSFPFCAISLQLWTEAMSIVDVDRGTDLPAFVEIFNARMASHARSKAPRLVAADLKALRMVYGKEAPMSELLGLLSEQAQVEILRAHSRSGCLNQARQWAHKVIVAANARQGKGVNKNPSHSLPLHVMNVLFSAYIKLKGNKKVMTARRRFSVLLRQAGAIKQQRMHLRRTITKFLRGKRKELSLRQSSPSRGRLYRLRQALDYLCAFATRHGIVPDEKTTRILLVAILRLSPRIVTKETLERIKRQADFDWKSKGIVKVLDEVGMLLKGKAVQPSCNHPQSTKEGRARAAMIDAAIARRQYWQESGSPKGAKR